jgi:hypothetical protein
MRVALMVWIALGLEVSAASNNLREVDACRTALQTLKSRQRGASVEVTFAAAVAVRRALLERHGDSTVIEDLSERDYAKITHDLVGMVVSREEVLLAEPDAKIFLSLARQYGGAADVAFFKEYLATFPDSVWPVYVEQQTDVTACTRFGAGALVRRYEGWGAFRLKYPTSYVTAAAERLSHIETAIAESTCACGSKKEVLRELQEFVVKFPSAPVAAKVRSRVRELKTSSSTMRFNCSSG